VALVSIGIDIAGLFSFGTKTTQHYLSTFVLEQIGDALGHGVFGEGIGSSTGAVRYVATGGGGVVQLGFESYYAKIAAELGSGGLAIFGIFFLFIAGKSLHIALRHRGTSGNALTAPLAIYVVFNLFYSMKGFVLDTDPGNIFFWLALGLLLGLDQEMRSTRPADQNVIAADRPLPVAGAAERQAMGGS
jgi:O-antigen ligase